MLQCVTEVMIMPHVSLRVTENEKNLMEGYAKVHGVKLSDAIKLAFFEKLEDEYDLKTIYDYESDLNKEMFSHDEVGKILGLK